MARPFSPGEATPLMPICFGLFICSAGLPWIRTSWWALVPIGIGGCFFAWGVLMAWLNRRG